MRIQPRTRRGIALAMAGLMALPSLSLKAEEAAAQETFDFFLQEAKVVTASRREQKKSDSPVAIDVITREEIEKSGAQTIYELLRFRVGVVVSQGHSIEGNPAQLNVRGLPEEFSQSLQVLIDGRSIISTFNSGVNWHQVPVALEEIERIEIVRGPNSALFGANAGQGVINIITRKADAAGGFNAAAGNYSLRRGHAAFSAGDEALAVRAGYSNRAQASTPNRFGEQPLSTNDVLEEGRLNGRVGGKLGENGRFDFSAVASRDKYISPPVLGVGGTADIEQNYALLNVNQSFSETLSAELNLSQRTGRSSGTVGDSRERVYDGDLIGRLSLLEGRSQSAIGVSLRYAEVSGLSLFSNDNSSPSMYAYSRREDETTRMNRLRRAYASEQLSITDWLSLAVAGSYEGSDTGGEQPAYQGALILKPIENYSLRLSGSRSPTMPSLLNKYGRLELLVGFDPTTVPLPSYEVYRVEGTNITPSQISSYEATLSGSFFDRMLTAELTGYQMELQGLPEFETEDYFAIPGSFVPFALGKKVTTLRYRNSFNMVMRGTETVLTFKPRLGTTVQLNHTYQDIHVDKPSLRYDRITPWNMVNLIVQSEIAWGLNGALNLGWQGEHRGYLASRGSGMDIPDQAKLDLRLGYRPLPEIEVYAAGLNLAHALRTESPDGTGVPQTYLGGVNISWGGSKP